jgi:hypothetical protein
LITIEEEYELSLFTSSKHFKLTQYLLELISCIMRLSAFPLAGLLFLGSLVTATTDPLNYRNIAGYVASNTSSATTALALIKSRPELSTLGQKVEELGGFAQAFDTDTNWKFTFFAPNNDAFESYTGAYFDTFEIAPYVRQASI